MEQHELTHEEEAKKLLALIEEESDFAYYPESPYTIIHEEFEEGGRWHNLESKTVRNTDNGRMFGWTIRVGATENQENEDPTEVYALTQLEPEVTTFDRYAVKTGHVWSRIERESALSDIELEESK